MKNRLMQYGRYFLLCGLFLLMLGSCAYAECETNAHVFMPDTDNDYKAELIRGNAEGEIWGVREHQTCVLCGKEKAVEIPGYTDELRTHTMEYDKDEGHGTGMHAYRYKCTVCNWSEVRFVVCSGPPCANAMEKVPVDEEAKLEENDELEVSDS